MDRILHLRWHPSDHQQGKKRLSGHPKTGPSEQVGRDCFALPEALGARRGVCACEGDLLGNPIRKSLPLQVKPVPRIGGEVHPAPVGRLGRSEFRGQTPPQKWASAAGGKAAAEINQPGRANRTTPETTSP